jgi:hypothetical protein
MFTTGNFSETWKIIVLSEHTIMYVLHLSIKQPFEEVQPRGDIGHIEDRSKS